MLYSTQPWLEEEHESTGESGDGRGGGLLRIAKAVDKRLLAALKILGVVELLRIPLDLIHELRDPNRVRARTGIVGEDVLVGGVGNVASVVRAVERLAVPARGEDDGCPDASGAHLGRELRGVSGIARSAAGTVAVAAVADSAERPSLAAELWVSGQHSESLSSNGVRRHSFYVQ